MSKRKWILMSVFIFTNLTSVFLGFALNPYIKQVSVQRNLKNSITLENKKDEYSDYLAKKGKIHQIHIGILIPKSLIIGDDEKDSDMAKDFIIKQNEWSYISSGDLFGKRGFVFQGSVYVPVENKLAVK